MHPPRSTLITRDPQEKTEGTGNADLFDFSDPDLIHVLAGSYIDVAYPIKA